MIKEFYFQEEIFSDGILLGYVGVTLVVIPSLNVDGK